MLALSLIQWWYFAGWKTFVKLLFQKISDHADYFSFGTLFRTFFAPFRQIDTESGGRSINERFSAFIGRTISRVIGAIIRFFILLTGIIVILVEFVFGSLLLVVWPFIPLIPLVCFVLFFMNISFSIGVVNG